VLHELLLSGVSDLVIVARGGDTEKRKARRTQNEKDKDHESERREKKKMQQNAGRAKR
jgi:hypothetical protein